MTVSDPKPPQQYDPESYRMTIGGHLEELRLRLILALVGLAVIATVCFFFGNEVLELFCRPIYKAQLAHNINTQLYTTELDEGFLVWLEVNLITAAVLSSPWMLYQIWKFVAAGLYPSERKYITRYIPLSIVLMISGMALVYFAVLPWTCTFFFTFNASIPTPDRPIATTQPYTPVTVPHLQGDPADPKNGEIWIDDIQGKVKLFLNGSVRSLSFNADALIASHVTLRDYIDMTVGLVITFAIAFQMPLVVLALVRIGIIELQTLKNMRRIVYFSMSIVAAVLAPHDVVTAQIALMIPLCLLYELGIYLAVRAERRAALEA